MGSRDVSRKTSKAKPERLLALGPEDELIERTVTLQKGTATYDPLLDLVDGADCVTVKRRNAGPVVMLPLATWQRALIGCCGLKSYGPEDAERDLGGKVA